MSKTEDSYKTVISPAEGEFKDKKSKFLGYIFEIENENQFKEIIEKVRKQHFKANHHCYAYKLGTDDNVFRYSDDGEPSGTAGVVIYNQLRSFELSNVLLVVVRYFGGVKLGVSGLINAYKNAAIAAINNSEIVEKYIENQIMLNYDFNNTGKVMKSINAFNAGIVETTFNPNPEISISLRKSLIEQFKFHLFSSFLDRDVTAVELNTGIPGLSFKILS